MGNQHETAFSLYQGEDLSEEQSVLGEIDEKKIPLRETLASAVGAAH